MHIWWLKNTIMGMSLAASWAWGASFAVTIALFETLGILPAIIWVTMNIFALPVFGLVYGVLPSFKNLKETCWFVKPSMVFVMVCSIWMNMQALYTIALRVGITDFSAIAGTLLLSSTILLMIAYGGLKWSIISDVWQYILMMIGIVILFFLSGVELWNGAVAPTLQWGINHIPFALWIGLTLWAGPLLDAMHWERHAVSDGQPSFNRGGMFFGCYIILVSMLAFLPSGGLLYGGIMLFVVMMVATSTLDSSASGLQYLAGKKWGIAVGAISVLSWPLIVPLGVINLFTFYGTFRILVVALMFGILYLRKHYGQMSYGTNK